MMPLELHPYDPTNNLKERARLAIAKLRAEHLAVLYPELDALDKLNDPARKAEVAHAKWITSPQGLMYTRRRNEQRRVNRAIAKEMAACKQRKTGKTKRGDGA
jgi:hypothetical protein